jgi:hypothetical protein
MVELTHSTCDRNVAICLEDATKKLNATIDRIVEWQMDWREILSCKAMKAAALRECESDGIIDKVDCWYLAKLADEAEEITLLRFKNEVGRYGKLLRCAKKRRRCK